MATANYLTPPEPRKERRTSQTGVKEVERAERLKRRVPDMPLSDLGVKQIDDVVTFWANRPASSQGAAFATTVCKHHIRYWKSSFQWLYMEQAFSSKQPPDLVWGRVRVLVHQHGIDARATPKQVATYTGEELRVLREYGTDTTRVLMALALNCGFGIAGIGSLKSDQVQGD
ncbi:MAG: hypothetical protein K2X82_05405 [Gemmataceae bacterium]|nr:hypothetical protein [Gemmataceae bacterium]